MVEKKETPIITFQSIRGMEMFKEETEEGTKWIIMRGKKPWAVFFGDYPNALYSMYTAYINTLTRCAAEAKARVENPEKAKEIAEDTMPAILDPEDTPLFAKNIKD